MKQKIIFLRTSQALSFSAVDGSSVADLLELHVRDRDGCSVRIWARYGTPQAATGIFAVLATLATLS
jgi:hypothetical protein